MRGPVLSPKNPVRKPRYFAPGDALLTKKIPDFPQI